MVEEKDEAESNAMELPERARDPGFWRETWQQVRLVYYLLRDPEVPAYLKLLPLAAVLYVLFPLDLAPDLWPVIGQLDDLTALLVGAKVFVDLAPPHVVARHMDAMQEEELEDPLQDKIVIDVDHELIGDRPRKQK
ncbi:MAG: DUF1232 domain-containing protein [Candidatus Promineifilaceae bacterium]|nr:DUF1232 domain-containing protein [Candidatus Promineifilaceae bacterium]